MMPSPIAPRGLFLLRFRFGRAARPLMATALLSELNHVQGVGRPSFGPWAPEFSRSTPCSP